MFFTSEELKIKKWKIQCCSDNNFYKLLIIFNIYNNKYNSILLSSIWNWFSLWKDSVCNTVSLKLHSRWCKWWYVAVFAVGQPTLLPAIYTYVWSRIASPNCSLRSLRRPFYLLRITSRSVFTSRKWSICQSSLAMFNVTWLPLHFLRVFYNRIFLKLNEPGSFL